MRDFRRLDVWHKAHAQALSIYRATDGFPNSEQYGLTSQMRRAAASIPTNIAEGCGREGDAELARYLRYSLGSASELEYQLILARDLQYLRDEAFERLTSDVTEVKRMLAGLLGRLKADS